MMRPYCEGEVKKRKGPFRFGHCTRKPKTLVQSTWQKHVIFSFCESCAKRYVKENGK